MDRQTSLEMKKELTTLELINNIQHGIAIFDTELKLIENNQAFLTLMDIPNELSNPGTLLIDFLRLNANRGIYGEGDREELAQENLKKILSQNQSTYDRKINNGFIIQIQNSFSKDGLLITTYTDVTTMRTVEQEINQRNKTLEAITENTQHGITLFDKNLILVACNSRFLELMEFPKSLGIPGKSMEEFFYYNAERGEYGDGNFDQQVAERIKLAKNFQAHKFERVRPNGSVIEVIGTPIAEGFVTTYNDITVLRKTQNKLEDAKQNLQEKVDEQTCELREKQEKSLQLIAAFDALRESVAIVDRDDRFVFTNKRYQKVNAVVRDKLIPGTPFEEYLEAIIRAGLVPEAIGQEKEWLKKRMDRHNNPSGPVEVARQSGIWLMVNEQKLDQGGTIMLGTDITERKKAEEALRDNEELLRATTENILDVFWITNIAGAKGFNVQYVNSAFERVWLRKRDELYADVSIWYDCIHPDDKDRVMKASNDFLQDKGPYQEEYRIITPDGIEKTIDISGNLIKDKNGNIVRAAGIARDITDQKKMEEQVRRSQKMEAVGQLTGGIAHDFNNILGIIQGNLELLEGLIQGSEKAEKRIEMALKGVDRGIGITRKLLGFSSKDARQVFLTSVNKYIENLETLIAKSLTAAVTVETRLGEDLWNVAIDPGDFEDAILNLSLNARDAMPDGGTLSLKTANKVLDDEYVKLNPSGKAGEFVMITVSDTGEGLPEELKEKIFEPFFTTKEQGKGTGLGLSMVYGFIERSGGHISLYSEKGMGTAFHIFLPRANESGLEQSDVNSLPIDLPRGSEKILVVDDEDALRGIAASYLELLGYEIISATGSQEAIEILKNTKNIDLLFSDVVMPGQMDGYQLATAAHKIDPDLKVLLTSGLTQLQEISLHKDNDFLSQLIQGMLSKPYNQAELASSIRKCLDNF